MPNLLRLFFFFITLPALSQPIVYVTQSGAGNASGTSWTNALSGTLLAGRVATSSAGTQFWVAAGVYKPTTTTDRTASFSIASGVFVYGGFSGTEATYTDRVAGENETTFSGDINIAGEASDNSLTVINVTNPSQPIILDGITIRDGYNTVEGAGLSILVSTSYSLVALKKCRFINNRIPGDLSGGGGLSLKVTTMAKCSLIVSHCYFAENRAGFGGAMGLVTQGGTYQLDLYDSVFEQNTALEGGALSSRYTEFQQGRMIYMVNCVYRRNSASKSGGALITGGGKVESAYCLFDNNSVANNQFSEGGGAINISNSSPTFSDCLFSNNKAPLGGAIYSESTTASTTPEFINCTFADNSATVAGGVISTKSSYTPPVAVTNETTLTNCIAWGNSAPLKPFFHSQPSDQTALLNATYSLIQGGYTGIGNISANPFFSNPATGNYQLLASSPAINAGSPDTSFLPSFDLAYQQRIQNGRVDMGAYEFGCIAAPCPPVSAQRIR